MLGTRAAQSILSAQRQMNAARLERFPGAQRRYLAFAGLSRFVSLPCLLDRMLSALLRISASFFAASGSTSILCEDCSVLTGPCTTAAVAHR